jgi:hypothetical protein
VRSLLVLGAVGLLAYAFGSVLMSVRTADAPGASRRAMPSARGARLDAPPGAAREAAPTPSPAPRRPRAGEWVTETIKALADDDPDAAGYQRLTFDQLSDFEYDPPAAWDMVRQAADPEKQKRFVVPGRIRRLSGRKVAIEGFMMPLDFDRGYLGSFVLNGSYDMCAFGMMPASLNEWVDAKMSGGRKTRFTGHFPVTVFGTLEVGPLWDKGRVTSLYRMEADFLGIDGNLFGD